MSRHKVPSRVPRGQSASLEGKACVPASQPEGALALQGTMVSDVHGFWERLRGLGVMVLINHPVMSSPDFGS